MRFFEIQDTPTQGADATSSAPVPTKDTSMQFASKPELNQLASQLKTSIPNGRFEPTGKGKSKVRVSLWNIFECSVLVDQN